MEIETKEVFNQVNQSAASAGASLQSMQQQSRGAGEQVKATTDLLAKIEGFNKDLQASVKAQSATAAKGGPGIY